ncbi:hypothetical protein [Enterococcus rotai]|uniref:hypothetical protein n=1 Tax=Enterococcus rotai TaxID=118060 RepID=UPI0032B38A3C
MKIFRGPLITFNIVKASTVKQRKDMKTLLEFSKHFDYKDMFYCTGPDICSIEPQENEPNYYQYEFYMSLNLPVEFDDDQDGNLQTLERLVIEDALIMRKADNEEQYFKADNELREYASANYKLDLSKKTYFVITEIMGEKIIDVYIPIEGGTFV